MNINDAYQLLGVDSNCSDDKLKKKYRELAKSKHPDKGGDPEEFKKINEAHQFILNYRSNPPVENNFNNFGSFSDFMSNMFNQQQFYYDPNELQPIRLDVNLSFEESILGCSKSIEFNKKEKCSSCDGLGFKRIKNNCKECNGFGIIENNKGNMFFQTSCHKCYGRGTKQEMCKTCENNGFIILKKEGNIQIKPGAENSNILNISGAGNYTRINGMHYYTDLSIEVHVAPSKEFTKEGLDVISNLDISLLDALQGKEVEVNTVYGKKKISIKPLSKNNEEIKIEKCGVKNTSGKHRVVLKVNYPENIDKLKEFLKGNENVI